MDNTSALLVIGLVAVIITAIIHSLSASGSR